MEAKSGTANSDASRSNAEPPSAVPTTHPNAALLRDPLHRVGPALLDTRRLGLVVGGHLGTGV